MGEGRAEALGQLFQHVIRREAHPAGFALCFALCFGLSFTSASVRRLHADGELHMAIAQVIAERGHRTPGGDVGSHYRLIRGADADHLTLARGQPITITQYRSAIQKQPDLAPTVRGGSQTTADAQLQRQGQGIEGLGIGVSARWVA